MRAQRAGEENKKERERKNTSLRGGRVRRKAGRGQERASERDFKRELDEKACARARKRDRWGERGRENLYVCV
eukprot:74704-Pleurochrysis_carterae.AAC.3